MKTPTPQEWNQAVATAPAPTCWGGDAPIRHQVTANAAWHMERARTVAISCKRNQVSPRMLIQAWRSVKAVPSSSVMRPTAAWLESQVKRIRHRNVPLHYVLGCMTELDNVSAIMGHRP